MRLRRLNLAQRIVAVVALAGVLRVLGAYIVDRLVVRGGWFSYAPLSREPPFAEPSFGPVLVWWVLIALWAIASIWLLGLPYGVSGSASGRQGPP